MTAPRGRGTRHQLELAELPGLERRATPGRRLERATLIGNVVASIAPALPFPPPDRPRTRAELARDRVVRLEELEHELTRFLAKCAPATWSDARRALWRILRRARRELRAAERSASPAETAAERAAGR